MAGYKIGDTFQDLINEIIKGATKSIEGIRNSTLTSVGLVGGMFDKDLRNRMQQLVQKNNSFDRVVKFIDRGSFTPFGQQNNIIKLGQDMANTDESLINQMGDKGQRLTRGVAQGVGNMIPMITAGNLMGTLGFSQSVAQGVSKATLFMGAAGQSTEEALNQGAEFNEAAAYGNLSGLTEVLTEMITGGGSVMSKTFGKGVVDNVISKVATRPIFKAAMNILGEGFEEYIAEAVDPFLQHMTYDKKDNLFQETIGNKQYWEQNMEAAIIGGLTSVVMGGANVNTVPSLSNDVQILAKKQTNQYARGIDTKGTQQEMDQVLTRLQQKLAKMDENTRKIIIKESKLENYFNEDGTLTKANEGAVNAQAMRGKLPDVKISSNVTEEQSKVLKLASRLNKRAVVANIKGSEGFYDPDTNTIVINSKSKNPYIAFTHELTHNIENLNQKSYGNYVDFIINELSTNTDLQTKLEESGKTLEWIQGAYRNSAKTKRGQEWVELTELVANLSEIVFGKEDTLARLADQTTSKTLLEKIYTWVKSMVKGMGKEKNMTPEEKSYFNMLKKAEKIYARAIEEAESGVKISDIDDTEENKRYSVEDLRKESIRKALAGELSRGETVHLGFTPQLLIDLGFGQKPLSITVKHLSELSDGTRHNIPVSYFESLFNGALDDPTFIIKKDNIYIFGTNDLFDGGNPIIIPIKKDAKNAKINGIIVDVNMVLSVYGKERLSKYLDVNIENIIYWNKEKASELNTAARLQLSRALTSLANNTSINQRKINVNNIRKSKSVDSEGDTLTVSQEAFFKDSQIRDENGNLLVTYHGTPFNKFYTFKGDMMFFSKSEKFAREYAEEKSFDNAMDAEAKVYKTYLNGKKLFDTRNEQMVKAFFKNIDLSNTTFGFANKTYSKDTWINNILGNVVEQPQWTKEQIKNAKFGRIIGDDKHGYNTDVFVGVDGNDDVVYVQGYYSQYMKYVTDEQKKTLLSGKPISLRVYNKRWNKEDYKEAFGYDPYEWDGETITIKPYKTTQKETQLTGEDNWTYLELTYDRSTNKGIVDLIKEAGFDSIKMYEHGEENYVVFSPNQIKLTTNKNPSKDKDIRYSIELDSEGNNLTEEQARFFENSKVRDARGNLIVLYHGSPNVFDVFEKRPGLNSGTPTGRHYFTPDKKYAAAYAEETIPKYPDGSYYQQLIRTTTGKKGQVRAFYLNMTNPFDLTNITDADVQKVAEFYVERRFRNISEEFRNKEIKKVTSSIEYQTGVHKESWFMSYAELSYGNDFLVENGYDGVVQHSEDGKYLEYAALESNQIKLTSNLNPTSNPNIRFSHDSEGNELTKEQQEYFKNTKVLDENGNLKVVYHGTVSGEFTIFDINKTQAENNVGKGFYFTSDEDDVDNNYADGGQDYDNKVARLAENIEREAEDKGEKITYEKAEQLAKKQLYKGSRKIEAYLNIEKPFTMSDTVFDSEEYMSNYDEEDFDEYEDHIGEVDQLLSDDVDGILYAIEQEYDLSQHDLERISGVIWDAYTEGYNGEQFKEALNELYLEDADGNYISNDVFRIVIQAIGYDGIIDPNVASKFNMNLEYDTVHYVAFNSNQIKYTDNKNPSNNPDIRYSYNSKDIRHMLVGTRSSAIGFPYYKRMSVNDVIKGLGKIDPVLKQIGMLFRDESYDKAWEQIGKIISKKYSSMNLANAYETFEKETGIMLNDIYDLIEHIYTYTDSGRSDVKVAPFESLLVKLGILDENDLQTQLSIAQRMHKEQVENGNLNIDEIVFETGWLLSKDNNWKYRIDTSDTVFNMRELDEVVDNWFLRKDAYSDYAVIKLPTVLQSPNLYKHYPFLEDIVVYLAFEPTSYHGMWDGRKIIANVSEMYRYLDDQDELENSVKDEQRKLRVYDQIIDYLEKGGSLSNPQTSDKDLYRYIRNLYRLYGIPNAEDAIKQIDIFKEESNKKIKHLEEVRQVRYKTRISGMEQFKKTIVHETQHAIQDYEIWAQGGNLDVGYKLIEAQLKNDAFMEAQKKGLSEDGEIQSFMADYIDTNKRARSYYAYLNLLGEREAKLAEEDMINRHRLFDEPYYEKDAYAIDDGSRLIEDRRKDLENFRYSKEQDSEGNNLTEQQVEYFKDSKARDAQGRLVKIYHGSDAMFDKFEKSDVKGFYYSNKEIVAASYIKETKNNFSSLNAIFKKLTSLGYKIETVYFERDDFPFPNNFGISPEKLSTLQLHQTDSPSRTKGYIIRNQDGSINDKTYDIFRSNGFSKDYFEDSFYEILRGGHVYSGYLNMKNPYIIKVDGYWNDIENPFEKNGDPLSTRNIELYAFENGHDGVIFRNIIDVGSSTGDDDIMTSDVYVVFNSNQFKNVDNTNPTKSENIRYSYSKGQVEKIKARFTKDKSYSKADAEKVVNTILGEYLVFENYDGDISNKTKEQIIEELWIGLNSKVEGERAGVAINIANYIIENGILEDIYANDMNKADAEYIAAANDFKHAIELSAVKAEIRNTFGKDNTPFMMWGKRKGTNGISMGDVISEMEQRGIQIEGTSEAEQFVNFYKRYRIARDNIKQETKSLKSELSKQELLDLKNSIVREVLNAWDNYGKATPINKQITKYQDILKNMKARLREAREMSFAISKMFKTIDRVSALEKYQSVEDIPLSQEIVTAVKLLRKIKTWRGNLASAQSVRNIFKKYMVEVEDGSGKKIPLYELYHKLENSNIFGDSPYGEMIRDLANGDGLLTVDDFNAIDQILENFIHNVKNYDRVWFENKEQSLKDLVIVAEKETHDTIPLKDNVFNRYKNWNIAPIWIFERISNFKKDGYFSKMFYELHEGVKKQAEFKRDVAKHYEAFFKSHRKEVESWREQTMDFNNKKVTIGQMISLYLLSQREQAQTHLYNISDEMGIIRISNESEAKKHDFKASDRQGIDIEFSRSDIEGIKFNDVQQEFIKLTKEFFNKIARDAKVETDVALFGVTNVGEEKYFPIRVTSDVLAKNIGDASKEFADLFSVYNASFNKNVQRNAKNKVLIENVLDVVERHTQQMAAYYGLAIPIKNFNKVMNKKTESGKHLFGLVYQKAPMFEKYIGKLLKDLQGVRPEISTFDRTLSKVRGWWARAALGINPKVWTTQFASLLAAGGVGIKYNHLAKGMAKAIANKTDFDLLYKYSPMLYDRARDGNNIDVGLLKQDQGVLGKVDKLTDLTTKPIGVIDRMVVGAVWNAALEQTKEQHDPYSEEHYQAAAKLTEEAVIRTQANWSPLYRPQILREHSSALQMVTMFMSEPLQVFSQLAGSIEKIKIARNLGDKTLIEEASNEARRYALSISMNAMYLVMIGMAFQWIKFGKDDEEEWWERALEELGAHFVGMLPIARDIYSQFQGYDLSNMYETGLTNIYNGIDSLVSVVQGKILNKKAYNSKDFFKDGRQLILGIVQTLGIPLKNFETYLTGILEKFNDELIYKYRDNYRTLSYSKDLTKAIEAGDDRMADTIIQMMFKERQVKVTDQRIQSELNRLYKNGYNIMPRTTPTQYTDEDGETVKLSNKQYKKYQETYNQANREIAKLTSNSQYYSMNDEAKSKAIKYIYDYYYNVAMEEVTGEYLTGKFGAMTKVIDVWKLASIKASAVETSADTDSKGNSISGTRKFKISNMLLPYRFTSAQRELIMAYLGYSTAIEPQDVIRLFDFNDDEQDEIISLLT